MNQPARARVSRMFLPAVLMALCVAVPVPVTANQDRAAAMMPPLTPLARGLRRGRRVTTGLRS